LQFKFKLAHRRAAPPLRPPNRARPISTLPPPHLPPNASLLPPRRYLYTGVKAYAAAAREVYRKNADAAAERGRRAAEEHGRAAAALAAATAALAEAAAELRAAEEGGGSQPLRRALQQAGAEGAEPPAFAPGPVEPAWEEDDAVATLMQVLHGRMVAMRGEQAAQKAASFSRG
jgi:hypothetical protein